MKTKFLAGLIATLVAIVFVVGISILLVLVFDINAGKNWFTYTAAFLTIAVWGGMYSWLKPKNPDEQDNPNETSDPTVSS